ncbi:dTMP kinase [Chloroflexota bacterium]
MIANIQMGLFIVFEGTEGTGKSTQSRSLKKRLLKERCPVILTYEPGGTKLGRRVRHWLKWDKGFAPQTELFELFLFLAARAELVEEVILPTLEKGIVVICDRYADSTVAYQGYGRGVDLSLIKTLNVITTRGLSPNLVVLLDMDAEKGIARKGVKKDRFEQEEIAFHHKVRQGYLKMAAAEPKKWLVIDADLPKLEIQELIWERVQQHLG